jgi:hypothetical protein
MSLSDTRKSRRFANRSKLKMPYSTGNLSHFTEIHRPTEFSFVNAATPSATLMPNFDLKRYKWRLHFSLTIRVGQAE